MFYSRFSLFTPLSTLLAAILYLICFTDILSRSFNTARLLHSVPKAHEIAENATMLQASSIQNATTIESSTALSEPRILQVSMLFGKVVKDIYLRCLETHLEYGKRWGYETHVLRQAVRTQKYVLLNKSMHILSSLFTEMAKEAEKRAEWIVWFDADTVLMNANIPWDIFLPPSDSFSDIHIVGSNDGAGFNSGVFLVRVCEWSVKVFTSSAALPDLRSDVELREDFVEQDALQWVFRRDGNHQHIVYTPQYWFNGYRGNTPSGVRDVENGDMMSHFAGWGDQKPRLMQELFDKLEHTPQEMQVPLKDTYYTAEVEAFWSMLRDAKRVVQEAKDFLDAGSSIYGPAEDVEKAYKELQENMRLHTGQVDVVEKSIGAVLTSLHTAKEAQKNMMDDRKGGREALKESG